MGGEKTQITLEALWLFFKSKIKILGIKATPLPAPHTALPLQKKKHQPKQTNKQNPKQTNKQTSKTNVRIYFKLLLNKSVMPGFQTGFALYILNIKT